MNIYDITIQITPEMPVWPGDSGVKITRTSSIDDGENVNVSHLSLGAHTGTHVDAPLHFIPDGRSLDKVPLGRFIGEIRVVELLDVDLITAETLSDQSINNEPPHVLFKTKNSNIWANQEKFQENFVALTPGAAQYLVDQEIDLVGIDYLSIAPYGDSLPTHKTLLGAGIVILEGVDLSGVEPGEYILFCLPMKVDGVDGAPARAILVDKWD